MIENSFTGCVDQNKEGSVAVVNLHHVSVFGPLLIIIKYTLAQKWPLAMSDSCYNSGFFGTGGESLFLTLQEMTGKGRFCVL